MTVAVAVAVAVMTVATVVTLVTVMTGVTIVALVLKKKFTQKTSFKIKLKKNFT